MGVSAKRWLARRELVAVDAELAQVARSAVSDRLALGEALRELGDRFRELGFRTFGMYVRERLSLGPRWCADARVLASRLDDRPALRAALLSGRIGWSLAELLARASTPEDEAELLDACASMTVREVRAALRAKLDDAPPPKVEAIEVGLTPTERLALRATQLGVEHVDGGVGETGQWLEHALAEAHVFLLARGVDVDEVADEGAPDGPEVEEPPPPERMREPIAAPAPIAATDPTELDAELRSRAARLANREARLGQLLLRFLGARGWRRLGYASEQQYCDERLGMSRASARKRVRLARHGGWLDGLTAAVRDGRLGIESAHLIAGVASPATLEEWIERAEVRTFKHLREEVRAVELAAELSGVPVGEYGPPSDEELAVVEAFEREVVSGASVARSVSDAMRAVQMSGGDGAVQMSGGVAAVQMSGGDAVQISGAAARMFGDDAAVQMSRGDSSVQMSADDGAVQMSGGDGAVQMSGGDAAVQMSGGDAVQMSGRDGAVQMSGAAVRMSGAAVRMSGAVRMSDGDELVQVSGGDAGRVGRGGAGQMSGDDPVQMPKESGVIPMFGEDGAVPAGVAVQMSAGDGAVEMSGGDGAVQMSGGVAGLVSEDDPAVQMSGGDGAVQVSGGDGAVQMSGGVAGLVSEDDPAVQMSGGDDAVQMSGGDDAVQMSGGAPKVARAERRRLTRLRARSDVITHYRAVERAFEGAGIAMSFPMFLATAFWMSWSETFFVGNRWKAVHDRDRHRCVSPVCESRSLTNHHVRYRAHGGGDELENQITLCEFCHLEGEHGGRLKVRGSAGALCWEFGRRPILRVEGRRKERVDADASRARGRW